MAKFNTLKLILTVKNQNNVDIKLRRGRVVLDSESLTISQEFDRLLIVGIDKLLRRNRIDRLLLKRLEISGKMRPGAVSSMILKTVKNSLEV